MTKFTPFLLEVTACAELVDNNTPSRLMSASSLLLRKIKHRFSGFDETKSCAFWRDRGRLSRNYSAERNMPTAWQSHAAAGES